MATPLFYSNNADLKYPLSDFHNEVIPNDILLNLTLGIPTGIVPAVAAIRVENSFVFISIEDVNTRTPVATVLINKPSLAKVYPLDMDVIGHGWVSFGPGATGSSTFYSGDILVGVDPECVTSLDNTEPPYIIEVNGLEFQVNNILDFLAENENIILTVDGSTIFIDRNDDTLSAEARVNLTATVSEISLQTSDVVFSVGGVLPDTDGNIDIDVVDCIPECAFSREIVIPRGDTGDGETKELPLDIFQPREFAEGDPCAPATSSEAPEEQDPFDGCNVLEKVDLVDPSNDKAVGTLYTQDGYTGEL